MSWKEKFPKENRYFETKNGILYCGDCSDILPEFPDKSVDLVLTDPPYACNKNYEVYEDTEENLRELIARVMPEILRVGRVALITCGVWNLWLYPKPYWVLAWVYRTTNTTGRWGFTQWQPILAYGKDPYLVNRMGRRTDVIEATGLSKKYDHPCPKPEKFWEKLLLRGSVKEGDLVLDPFIGSGTTAVVAERNNRRWIGIELNPKYCEIVKKRVLRESMRLLRA